MEAAVFLDKLLKSYERYYTVKNVDVTVPFVAEASFNVHSERYVLVKAAKIAEMDSNEYVYFQTVQNLSLEQLSEYSKKAWEAGISKVVPYYGHRNSDVSLVIIADRIDEDCKKQIKKIRYSKSYKLTFFGWSNFKLVVKELSSDDVYCNRLGDDLKRLLAKIN